MRTSLLLFWTSTIARQVKSHLTSRIACLDRLRIGRMNFLAIILILEHVFTHTKGQCFLRKIWILELHVVTLVNII